MLLKTWRRVPVGIRGVIVGFVVFQVMQVGQMFLLLNAKLAPKIAWTVPVALAYLWVTWKYFAGSGWPSTTAAERRRSMRTAQWSRRRVLLGSIAGIFIVVHLGGLAVVSSSLIAFPAESFEPPAFLVSLSTITAFPLVLAFALVAAVSEEAGFRGYMQVSLEKRYGPRVAIIVSALIFWLAHFSHVDFLHRTPTLFGSGLFLGYLAFYCSSLWPAILVHFLANAIGFTAVAGLFGLASVYRSETIWDTGVDFSLLIAFFLAVTAGVISVLILRRLKGWREEDGAQPTTP